VFDWTRSASGSIWTPADDPVYQPFLDSLLKYLAGENKGLAS
jgi:hypothetical protein